MVHREKIEIRGIVQGVGFRPFIYNLAEKHCLNGFVRNDSDGVTIEVEGMTDSLDSFASGIMLQAPSLSRIVEMSRSVCELEQGNSRFTEFSILESTGNGKPRTLIPPDVSVCSDCLNDTFDPENARYLYPFTNCTNCGPRFSIIQKLPYDRPFTTMSSFKMCSRCNSEYTDPVNRRFHAQPISCPECGPELKLLNSEGKHVDENPVLKTISLLKEGAIVAVKGIGGFHLAVDACNSRAVKRLRERKMREERPFALMTGTFEDAMSLARFSDLELNCLESCERPIVLVEALNKSEGSTAVAEGVAPGNPYLGIMLPYTPLHYLMFFHPGAGGDFKSGKTVFKSLVMTSGNISDEPICRDNSEALERLASIADAFLVHDRDIHIRSDDSIVRVTGNKPYAFRRSRGYAPVPVFLNRNFPEILALGGELKNTICLTDGKRAFVGQHTGDLEKAPSLEFFEETVRHFSTILELNPKIFAYDLHPEYLSSKYFRKTIVPKAEGKIGAVGIQHHHAHIASVMAEYNLNDPVIGFAMDGTGYGLDGTIWGGEVLLTTPFGFERFAHFDSIPLPGGHAAIKENWRTAFSYLRSAFGDDWRDLELPCISAQPMENLEMLDIACSDGLNAPHAGTAGRLFDAVSSILNICHYAPYEGKAAMMLEWAALSSVSKKTLPYEILEKEPERYDSYPECTGTLQFVNAPDCDIAVSACHVVDFRPLIREIVRAVNSGIAKDELAAAFHNTLVKIFVELAELARDLSGIETIALSGGTWQNRLLLEKSIERLSNRGFTVYHNRQVPVNDGGISLGQAYIAGIIANCTI
ncbi:carbamoyltransferase HypF [candidate division KSB1 bacterium]